MDSTLLCHILSAELRGEFVSCLVHLKWATKDVYALSRLKWTTDLSELFKGRSLERIFFTLRAYRSSRLKPRELTPHQSMLIDRCLMGDHKWILIEDRQ